MTTYLQYLTYNQPFTVLSDCAMLSLRLFFNVVCFIVVLRTWVYTGPLINYQQLLSYLDWPQRLGLREGLIVGSLSPMGEGSSAIS